MSFHKDINKHEYLQHPELRLLYRKEYIKHFLLMHIPFALILLVTRDYPDFLGSMDVTIFLFWLLFLMVLKPMMMKGKITAYYREHYKTAYKGSLLSVTFTFLLFGAIMRTIVMVGFILLQAFSEEDANVSKVELLNLKANLLNMHGIIAGLLIAFLFFYLIFYKVRTISIQEFSNRAMKYIRNRGYRLDAAIDQVWMDRKWELENKAIKHVKYDEVRTKSVPKNEKSHQNVSVETSSTVSEPAVQGVDTNDHVVDYRPEQPRFAEPLIPMRRQARK